MSQQSENGRQNSGCGRSSPHFVGRPSEINFFTDAILKAEEPTHNIVSVSGIGGAGNFTLLVRFRDEARQPGFKEFCLTASVDEQRQVFRLINLLQVINYRNTKTRKTLY